jgi:arylsulfatase A
MKVVIAALIFFTLNFSALFSRERPDFVIVMVDDMGYSDIGCYGADVIETPQLDRIAMNGNLSFFKLK